jgi:hypothetical protein
MRRAVNVIETLVEADQFLIHASDTSTGAMEGVAQDYWRAYFDLGSRIATLSVFALDGETVTRGRTASARCGRFRSRAAGQRAGREGVAGVSPQAHEAPAARRAFQRGPVSASIRLTGCGRSGRDGVVSIAAHPGDERGPWDSNSPGFFERLGLGQSLKRWRRALQAGGLSAAELRAMLSRCGHSEQARHADRGGADGAVVAGTDGAVDQRYPMRLVRPPRRVARSDATARDRRPALAFGACRAVSRSTTTPRAMT